MNKQDRLGAAVRWSEMQPMTICMHGCGLEDMKASGRFYTWSNKQEGVNRVFSKIDRAMCNGEWCLQFPTTEAMFLPENTFDHTPIVIKVFPSPKGKKPFRFYNYWTQHHDFMDTVQQVWATEIRGCHMFQIMQKLKLLKGKLRHLCQNEVQDPHNKNLIDQECQASRQFREANAQYQSWLHQKAKLHWLQMGDSNSKIDRPTVP
ncbi:Microtubule-associated tumor suppressor candidate 2 [Bienertia sinuspersici]